MNQYFEVIKKSKNFPRDVNPVMQKDIRLYPVLPDEFDVLDEELVIKGSAVDAVQYVQSVTEKHGKEYTLVLYGERCENFIFLRDYSIGVGLEQSASFQKEQLRLAKKTYKKRYGEVVFAHTHVAKGVSYNYFSVNDLVFIAKMAIQNNRDVYAVLITKDGAVPVKYSLAKNEFFRVRIKIA